MKKIFLAILLSLVSVNLSSANPSEDKIAELKKLADIRFPNLIADLKAKRDDGRYTEQEALSPQEEKNINAQLTTLVIGMSACKARIAQLEMRASLKATPTQRQLQRLQDLTEHSIKTANTYFSRSYCARHNCSNHFDLQITCARCGIARYCNEQCQQTDGNSHEISCVRWHKKTPAIDRKSED